jgi:hypothetical protein
MMALNIKMMYKTKFYCIADYNILFKKLIKTSFY